MLKILVVDDNRSSADAMSRILSKQGHAVESVYDGATAIAKLSDAPFDLVLTDLKMEPVDGMQVLRAARSMDPPLEVIVFTAFGAVEKAVEAMQLGARDFLTKPVSVEQILERLRQITGEAEPPVPDDAPIIAESTATRSLLSTLQAVADVPSPVWIEGEIGSGRLAAAAQLHAFASEETPYAVVDPLDPRDWPAEGTVVLPSVDDLNPNEQLALMRRLKTVAPTVRLVATAQPEGRRKVAEGAIRGDLYFALAVVVVEIPPLRERPEDIVPMFEVALTRYCERYGRPKPHLSASQLGQLVNHAWPGNVRELYNLAESTAVLGASGFGLEPIAPSRTGLPVLEPGFKLASYLEQIEKDLLEEALRQSDGDRNAAGRLLGVERNTLRYKLNKYGLLPR